jgi:rubrerythrin
MALNFNAREIFDMGIQIEVNGKTFYETAAKKTAETSVRDFFKELAAWENQHVELFTELRDSLPAAAGAADIFDPNGEAEGYIRATGDSHVFIRNTDIAGMVAGCKNPVEILDLALQFEKDSVVFYTTMKKVVAKNLGQDKVDRLIDEEIKHISLLTQRQAKLKARG